LHTAHLEHEDAIQVADRGYLFKEWKWDKPGKKWQGATTVTRDAVVPETGADAYPLPRNSTVWVSRGGQNKGSFFIVGQYSKGVVTLGIEGDSADNPVCTLVPNPSLAPFPVNGYGWGTNPVVGDTIRIPNEKEAPCLLRWNGSEWGRLVKAPGERYGVWKNDATIPAGTGFWYMRRAGAFEITLPKTDPAGE
jgi:hypothetical protein